MHRVRLRDNGDRVAASIRGLRRPGSGFVLQSEQGGEAISNAGRRAGSSVGAAGFDARPDVP